MEGREECRSLVGFAFGVAEQRVTRRAQHTTPTEQSMQKDDAKGRRLGHAELAAIDHTITALQMAGHKIGGASKDDNPRQQMAEAWLDAHHPMVDLNEHDREIIGQIKRLAGQLSSRTSLTELLEVRAKIVQGG